MADKTKAELEANLAEAQDELAKLAERHAQLEANHARDLANAARELDNAKAYAEALEEDAKASLKTEGKGAELSEPSVPGAEQFAEAIGDAIVKAQTRVAAIVGRNRKNTDGPNGTHLVAPEHRGTITYIVGPGKHVRGNRTYQHGEEITVTNERPAKDWVKKAKDGAAAVPELTAVGATGRASDQTVG